MEQGQGDTRAESWGGEPIALLADRMQAAAEGFSTWCDSHKGLLIALFSLFHFGVLLLVAQHTQFWFDELFTYYIALLPTVPDILSELGKAVDHHPPAYFLLNRFVAGLFSDPHIGFRIPAIAGFWMLCVGLFLYVSRRSSAVFGLLAICLAHISGARYWATEARPYSLAAGLGTVALVAWQMATDKQKRTSWLIALALSLVAAVSVSYYSVLLLIPLAVAEAVRTMRRGKADLPVWFSLAAGAASGIVYLPAVRQSVEIFNPNNWARPRAGTIPGIYASFFASLMFFMLGALLVVAVLHVFRLWAVESRYAGGERKVRPEDLALGIGLLLLPVAGMAAALLVTHMLTARYVISTVAGFCILCAVAGVQCRSRPGRRGSGAAGGWRPVLSIVERLRRESRAGRAERNRRRHQRLAGACAAGCRVRSARGFRRHSSIARGMPLLRQEALIEAAVTDLSGSCAQVLRRLLHWARAVPATTIRTVPSGAL